MRIGKRVLLIAIPVFIIGLLAGILQPSNDPYALDRLDRFVEDNAVISLADVFPGEWDTLQIMNTPNCSDIDRDEIYAFCAKTETDVLLVDKFYLLVFRLQGEIVSLIQYAPGSGGPMFLDDGVFKEQWTLTVPKEDSFFRCVKIRSDRHSWFPSSQYTLEYVGASEMLH